MNSSSVDCSILCYTQFNRSFSLDYIKNKSENFFMLNWPKIDGKDFKFEYNCIFINFINFTYFDTSVFSAICSWLAHQGYYRTLEAFLQTNTVLEHVIDGTKIRAESQESMKRRGGLRILYFDYRFTTTFKIMEDDGRA